MSEKIIDRQIKLVNIGIETLKEIGSPVNISSFILPTQALKWAKTDKYKIITGMLISKEVDCVEGQLVYVGEE